MIINLNILHKIIFLIFNTVYREHAKKRKHIQKIGHMVMKKKLKVYVLLVYKKSLTQRVI